MHDIGAMMDCIIRESNRKARGTEGPLGSSGGRMIEALGGLGGSKSKTVSDGAAGQIGLSVDQSARWDELEVVILRRLFERFHPIEVFRQSRGLGDGRVHLAAGTGAGPERKAAWSASPSEIK
jgi:hypothetical protein